MSQEERSLSRAKEVVLSRRPLNVDWWGRRPDVAHVGEDDVPIKLDRECSSGGGGAGMGEPGLPVRVIDDGPVNFSQ